MAVDFVREQIPKPGPSGPSTKSPPSRWACIAFIASTVGFASCASTGSDRQAKQVQSQLSVIPINASFPNVVVGTNNTMTITLTSSGNTSVTVSQSNVTGAGFSVVGLTPPITLTAGQSGRFTVRFTPQTPGNVAGTLSLFSDASNSPTTVSLSGSGVAPIFLLAVSPTLLSFGKVTVGSSATQTVTLTNTGNSTVNISQINVSGSEFSESGLTPPLTLAAGQAASLSVTFAPIASGAATGSVSVVSDAINSLATIALSGSSLQSHSSTLSWNPSASVVVGYNVYRATQPGGPYTELGSSPVSVNTYADSSVLAGQRYFYVVTAVDSTNVESVYSNEVSTTIPSP